MRRSAVIARFIAAVLAAASLTALGWPRATLAAAEITLTETGSTLFYPLFRIWSEEYARANPAVRIAAAGTDSSAGVAQAAAGAVQIGVSDAFMSDEEVKGNPQIVNIPLAISAATVNYNLPGLNATQLKLSGPVIAGIYLGTITQWDAKPIADLNPGVNLPRHAIVPIHRSDGSGTTFVFSQFLAFSTPAWESGPGVGNSLNWPAALGAVGVAGNGAVVEAVRTHPYSLAYIGTSFHDQIVKAHLGTARLENQDGNFVLPTPKTILAGASELDPRTPNDERLSLVYAPGADSYPIINYEYAIVSTRQPSPATAGALRDFLLWAIEPCSGNAAKNLDAVHFIPLPEFVRALSIVQIQKIQ